MERAELGRERSHGALTKAGTRFTPGNINSSYDSTKDLFTALEILREIRGSIWTCQLFLFPGIIARCVIYTFLFQEAALQKDGYTKWNKFNPTTGEIRDLGFGLVFGFGFVGVWFCWGFVLFCFNLNFAFGFYECNPLRPRSTVKCGRPRISKSDCVGPSGTRNPALASQAAEERPRLRRAPATCRPSLGNLKPRRETHSATRAGFPGRRGKSELPALIKIYYTSELL